jgi:DNA-binding IclR family transcriptional regulator
LGLNKSTCYNILQVLTDESLVVKDSGFPVYRLGPRLIELGTVSRRQISHRNEVAKIIRPLITSLGVTCLVAQPLAGDRGIIVVDRIFPDNEDALAVPVGTVFAITAPALGRAVLAWRDIDEVFANARRFDDVNEGDLKAIASTLEVVREKGFGWSNSEYQPGTNAVAAPIFGADLEVSLVLCLIAPTTRLPTADINDVGSRLVLAAREVASLLARGSVSSWDTPAWVRQVQWKAEDQ